MTAADTYEVFAVRYGRHEGRSRRENFIITDDHDTAMPLDYYVWAIVGEGRTIVVDTGFTPVSARLRESDFSPRHLVLASLVETRQITSE